MNSTTVQFLKSLGITTGIATICGISGALLKGVPGFISGFLIGFVLQIIIAYMWKSYLIHRADVEIAAIDADLQKTEIEQLTKQNIDVPCAYCRAGNKTNIRMDRENTFRCTACNQLNVVLITLSTARVTAPLDLNGEALLNKAVDSAEPPVSVNVKDLSEPLEFRST